MPAQNHYKSSEFVNSDIETDSNHDTTTRSPSPDPTGTGQSADCHRDFVATLTKLADTRDSIDRELDGMESPQLLDHKTTQQKGKKPKKGSIYPTFQEDN